MSPLTNYNCVIINQINYLKVNHLKWVKFTHYSKQKIDVKDELRTLFLLPSLNTPDDNKAESPKEKTVI